MTERRLAAVFDDPRDFLVGDVTGPERGWRIQRTLSFASLSALHAAVTGPTLDPAVRAVLYDPEHWPLTPVAEQRDPAGYIEQAASVAHARHLLLIATPATDLVGVLAPGQSAYPGYLRLDLAGAAARYADVVDIQAQGAETDASSYAAFVEQAAVQARQANPKVVVLAGLSTNPDGHTVTAQQVLAAINATKSIVDGYWLNVPTGGTACPHCGAPQPQVATAVLAALYPNS